MNSKAFVVAFVTVLIWGSSFAAIRVGLRGGITPGHMVLLRYLIASGLFLIYALWPGVKFKLPKKGDIIRLLILGWVGITLYHIGVTFGEQTVSAGTAGMLIGSGPIFIALLAVIILKERLGVRGWIGMAIGFSGIVIITLGTGGASIKVSTGALLILMAAFVTSVLFVYQKPLLERYSSIELTAYFTWAGTLPFIIFAPGLIQNLQHATMEANLSSIYIGIFPTAIGYATWAYAMSLTKASSVSSMLYLEPVVAIIVAWIWLKEWPTTISIIGGIIAISGVLVVNMKGKQRRPAKENAA